jgi:hypothetical protein
LGYEYDEKTYEDNDQYQFEMHISHPSSGGWTQQSNMFEQGAKIIS